MVVILLILAIAAALASQSPDDPDNQAADWPCARPLISKNFSQPYKSHDLALRISDECARPFHYRPTPDMSPDAAESLRSGAFNVYLIYRNVFVVQIQNEIERARRERDIPLKH